MILALLRPWRMEVQLDASRLEAYSHLTAEMQTDADRGRYEGILEWMVAAVLVVGLTAAGSMLLQGARTVDPLTPVIAREPSFGGPAPAAVPPGAVSVPLLLLGDGLEIRVGDSFKTVASSLGSAARTGIETVEPTTHGERITRVYQHTGTRFVLVFEPPASEAEPRVAAIYLR